MQDLDKLPEGFGQRIGLDVGREALHYPLADLPRQVAHALTLRSIGFEPEQRSWIDRDFEWIGIAFILAGSGFCEIDDRRWRVEGPCVLLQWPGHHYRHGPITEWECFYITYDESRMPCFQTAAWEALKQPFITFNSADFIRRRCKEIVALTPRLGTFGAIDRIDQLCEQLLLDTLIAARQPGGYDQETRLRDVRTWLEGHYTEDVDLDQLARDHNFAPRTFRRYWRQRYDMTLGDYLTNLRMRRACDLLTGGELPIAEIAALVGYNNPFYFTRRFGEFMGQTPTAYREANRRAFST